MEFKDLTKEQAIEIAKLAFGHDDWITSEIEAKYQPYIPEWYEDAQEAFIVKFEGYFAGTNTKKYVTWIYPNLNVCQYYLDGHLKTLGVSNQRIIQKKFTEYGFE